MSKSVLASSDIQVTGRLAALKKRHHELSREVDQARVHASVSDVYLHDLKKQKLHIKDLIDQLSGQDGRRGQTARA
jgi:hypothetical protein